jgi:hypothetical protein
MIDAVDTALAHETYPSWAKVVCGYAGGHTYHVWTLSEVEAVRKSGRQWWAIWTALNKTGTLNATLGRQDALNMMARLPYYGYTKNFPVFYDIEPAIFDRDPVGARAAIAAWKLYMHNAGYLKAYVYTVARQGGDWVAAWTNVRPSSIPSGKIGVQYGGDKGGFDYNVFAESISPTSTPEDDVSAQEVWDFGIENTLVPDGLSEPAKTRLLKAQAYANQANQNAAAALAKATSLESLLQQLVTSVGTGDGSVVIDYERIKQDTATVLESANINIDIP